MKNVEVMPERQRSGRTLAYLLAAAIVAGLAVAGAFWRRQIQMLVRRARPYERRRSEVRNPTLIINRWSGDGKGGGQQRENQRELPDAGGRGEYPSVADPL